MIFEDIEFDKNIFEDILFENTVIMILCYFNLF